MGYRCGRLAPVLVAAAIAFLLAPLLAVVPISLTPERYLSLPDGEYSLRHYRALVEEPAWGRATWLSLRVGLAASAISTALATAFATGVWLARPRLAGPLVGFVLLPAVAPPVVSAIILYFLLTTLSRLGLPFYDAWPGVVLAHVVMTAPFAVIVILASLAQVDRRLDMAARACGASLTRRVVSVILPSIRLGVASAAFLCFVLSWEEIAVTLFITNVDAITLPGLMWAGLRDNVDPAIAAASVLLILVTVAGLAAVMALRRSLADP